MYGSLLRSIRESRGLTQAQLSEVVGIEQSNLSAYENDRRLPSIGVVNKIVVGCGYLLRIDGAPSSVKVPFPKGGWFPDEDLPEHDDADPGESGSPMRHDAPMAERVEAIHRVLELADSQRSIR